MGDIHIHTDYFTSTRLCIHRHVIHTPASYVGRASHSRSAFSATAGAVQRLGMDLLRWIVRYGGAIERTTSRHGLGRQLESKKPCGSPKYSVVRRRRRRRTRYSIWRSQSRTGE